MHANKLLNRKPEVSLETTSLLGMNAFVTHCSSPRATLALSALSQSLTFSTNPKKYGRSKRILTGIEKELAKYTIAVRAECDMTILKIVELYKKNMSDDTIKDNPQLLVFYENLENGEVNCFEIHKYNSLHQYFGYDLIPTEHYYALTKGASFKKGTVFADSPSVDQQTGIYDNTVTMNLALLTNLEASEDGIVINEDILPQLRFKVYEKRIVDFGSSFFALNIYADSKNYKPIPDIGDMVREDGLLMALRQYDIDNYACSTDIYSTAEVDHIFDKAIYAGDSNGKIIDIRVLTDDLDCTATGMVKPLQKYAKGLVRYHQEIINTYNDIRSKHFKKTGGELPIGSKLHRLLIESYAITDNDNKKHNDRKLTKTYRTATLDDYRIEFTIEYELTPTIGFKLTNLLGGKGVICSVKKANEMPMDADGNVADIIMERDSIISRMNPGILYEQYFNAAARDVSKDVRQMFSLQRDKTLPLEVALQITQANPAITKQAMDYVLGLYEYSSKEMFNYYSKASDSVILNHIAHIIHEGIYLYMPIDTELEYSHCVNELEKRFNFIYGPVSFDHEGKRITTKAKARIGGVSMLLLEKVSRDGSSVSSAKLSANGIITISLRSDKFSSATKNSAVRLLGESETRVLSSVTKTQQAALEMFDRQVSPGTHRSVIKSILTAQTPTNIENCVDRKHTAYGGNRALLLVKSVFTSMGIKLEKS